MFKLPFTLPHRPSPFSPVASATPYFLRRGFSIIEVSVVIVVIAILATATISSTMGYQTSARDSERALDISTVVKALERYYRTQAVATGPTYPPTTIGVTGLTTYISDTNATTAPNQSGTAMAIATSSADQSPALNQYMYQPLNVDGTLCTSAPCVRFKLYYRVEAKNTIVVRNSMRQQ